ncbi:TIR domain-containing protein [Mycoplasma capricolum]|uniref:TIR domain-containing protein n=1 Tax=Mycoplasma capricolum TaxID=2095 RepID=UPI003DA42400
MWRVNVVRNSWVIRGKKKAGFIDKAEFEKTKLENELAIKKWIDKQLMGTSVTVVLIGSETLNRKFVQYEIQESIKRKNGIVGISIGRIKNQNRLTSISQSPYTIVNGYRFIDICDGFYDYVLDDGYSNMGKWIEQAAKKKGK